MYKRRQTTNGVQYTISASSGLLEHCTYHANWPKWLHGVFLWLHVSESWNYPPIDILIILQRVPSSQNMIKHGA